MSSGRKLRFLSWNSNGLKTKIDKVKHQIKQQNCDVVFLQETRSGESNVFELLEDEYKSFYTTQTSNSSGVAIFIKTNILEETGYTIDRDPAGCYILVKCTLNGQLFTLVSVYSSHSDTNPLLKLRSVLEKHAEGILLIGGDFNVALNPYLDTVSTKRNNNHSLMRLVVKEFMTSFQLVDVWRRLHPKTKHYSFQRLISKQEQLTLTKSRLDYIFVPEESMQYIEKCDFSKFSYISDHSSVEFEIIFKESNKLELYLIVFKEEDTKDVSSFQQSLVDKWLSCKRQHCPNIDFTVNSYTSQIISASEIERAIQSLIVNDVERPDGLPLSFYKGYSYVLIPYLCTFYNNILEQPTKIPKSFNKTKEIKVSENLFIFNADYLILATIMARWLYEHLQSQSTHCTFGDNKNSMLLTFKRAPIEVKWSTLQNALAKEQNKHRTETPLQDRFRLKALQMMLNNNPSGEQKSLLWGCPLTPVLMTLCLKHIANEMIKNVQDQRPTIHISRENVIVRFSDKFDKSLLDNLKGKHTYVDFEILERIHVKNLEESDVEELPRPESDPEESDVEELPWAKSDPEESDVEELPRKESDPEESDLEELPRAESDPEESDLEELPQAESDPEDLDLE